MAVLDHPICSDINERVQECTSILKLVSVKNIHVDSNVNYLVTIF